MRIEGWFIEAWGMLRGYEVRGLGPGLTTLAGANETGKSTLVSFIRGALFGFSDRRSRDGLYLPVDGSVGGGRLFAEGPEGGFTVERRTGRRSMVRVTASDGREVPIEEVARWMGGADETLFRSVFAFSLSELQSLQSLKAEEIRERIYSAHVVGAGQSARKVIDTLSAEMTARLRPRGASEMSEQAEVVEMAAGACQRARQEQARHAEWLEAEESARAEVEAVDAEIGGLRERKQWFAALREILPLWRERERARQTPPAEVLAEAVPLAGLDNIRTSLEESERAAQEYRQKLESAREENGRLAAALVPYPYDAEAVARAVEELPRHSARGAQVAALRERLDSLSQEIAQALGRLGEPWTEAAVAAGEWGEGVRGQAAEWFRVAASTWNKVSEQRIALGMASGERKRLAAAIETEREAAPDSGEAMEALRRLRSVVAARDSEQRALEAIQSARARVPVVSSLPAWAIGVAASAVVLMLAVAGSIARTSMLGAFGLIVAAILVMLVIFMRATLNQPVDPEEGSPEEQAARQKIEQLNTAASSQAESAGLAADIPVEQIDERMQALAAGNQEMVRREALLQSLSAAEQNESRKRADVEAGEAEWNEIRGGWEAWRHSAGLPETANPETAVHLLNALDFTAGLLRSRASIEAELARAVAESDAWEGQVRELLGSQSTGAALVDELRRAQSDAEADRRGRGRIQELAAEIAAIERYLELQEKETERIASALESLEQSRPVVSFDAHSLQQIQEALNRREDDAIARMAGVTKEQLQEALASEDQVGWAEQESETSARLEALERQRDDAVGRMRVAGQERRRIEQSVDVAARDAEFEQAKAELERSAREWSVASVARRLVEVTLDDYTEARQPGVLRDASESFARITSGAYRRVVQDESGQTLQVEDAAGRFWKPDELSRGTVEQLFLCLRLGLAAEFERAGTSLPFVMDDVLVNFDPERARAAAEELRRFASEAGRQVLFFTCHPETAAILGGSMIEMDRKVLAAGS